MGKQINQSIVIDAKIKATLEGMNDVVSKLNKGLREGTTKIDLTKGVGNSISKQIETFKTEYSKFIQLTKTGKIEFGDTKDAIRSGEQMVKTFSELKRIVGNFEDMSLLDAKKMFPDAFDSKVDSLSKKLNTLRENIVSLDSKKIELNDARQALTDLTVKQQDLQKELSEQLEVKIDTETAEQNLEETKKKIFELREELKKELSGKLAGTDSIKNSLEARKAEILKARKTRGVTSEPLSGAQVKAAGGSKEQQAAASQALKLYNSEKAELKEIEEALRKNATAAKEYRKALTSADSAKLTDLADKAESSESKINEITDALKKQEQAQIDLNEASERREQQEKKTSLIKKDLDETTRSLELQEQKVNKLQTAYEQLIAKTNPEELTKAFKELGIDFTPEMAKNEKAVRQLQEQLNALDEQDHQKLIQSLQNMGLSADSAEDYVRQLKGQLTTIDDSAKDISHAAQEIENLKNQIFQFFSVTNAIQLFKRTVQSAINTVKELDAVMTETAVVTDFSVGDMWEKLPEYASHANTLGASIKDVYAATTLYYQQGLQTNEAMSVGVETMKMARIANLDAGDATQYMTAALRGFNMEVNELNAQKVNDVYSELAAITAADTSQIATAMSKTASIASAANMEFETTAALLAQIIETTQEAPETAGTALKTIIARFSEVKKLREEGQMTGEDEEGEAIDVNKIQGALRTVGISMDDFFAGTEGLDSVLLKLAEKWKDLDFTTQRYIATTAAGSRQQSRFIAMMSDYERTMELATAANNSAGASQQQFDKTLESMEAKLQKLKNAWDEFAMGLANNEILKFGVDLLTGVLEAVNKLTNALSGGGGLVKSIISLMTAIGALKGGSMLLGKAESAGFFGKTFDKLKRQPINENSESQNRQKGERDGKAYIQSFNRAIEQGKKDGIKSGIKGFFGEQFSMDEIISEEVFDDGELSSRIDDMLMTAQRDQGIFDLHEGGQDLTPFINQLSVLQTELQEGKITAEEAKQKFAELGGDISNIGTRTVESTKSLKGFKIDLEGVGMAAVGVGTAFNLLGSLAEKLGLDGLSSALKGIGSVLAIVGSAVMALGPILTKLGVEFTTLGIKINGALIAPLSAVLATIWPVVLALGALAAAIAIAYNASPEVQLKKAQEAAAQAGEAANAAAEAYDNLKSSLESIEGKEAVLEDLTVGTLEWKEAVSELNSQILDLIQKYPELAKFVKSSGGVLTISDQGVEEVLQKQHQQKLSTSTAEIQAQREQELIQRQLDYNELDNKLYEYRYNDGSDMGLNYQEYLKKAIDAGMTEDDAKYQFETYSLLFDNKEATEELARAIASGDWEGKEEQIEEIGGIDSEGFIELKEFGQSLLTSDAAIKVFTDSLLNTAMMNAELSEENKEKISGIYDAKAIENMINLEKENIDLSNEEKREENKKEYARIMKYQYENGKFYSGEGENKKEVTVLDQDIKSQLAAINVQNDLTNNLTKMTAKFDSLIASGAKLGQSFVNMASKADGAGLTLADLNNMKGQFDVERDENGRITVWSQALADIYSEVGSLYSSPEEFYRIFSEAYSQAEERKASSEEKLTHMGMEGAFQNAKIDTGALAGITDNLYDVFLTSGPDVAQALAGSIEETLKTIEDPEQAQIFADALNAIDWQNLDDVEELDTILAGMDFDYAIDGLDELKQEIITAAKATKTFNLDAIKEQVKSVEELVADIEDREDTERTFTKEEYDTIIKANPELASQFVATGLDEFAYVGDSMQSLIEALNQNTAALLGDYGKQVRGNAAMSEKWVALEDQRFNSEYSAMELITSVIGGSIDASLYDVREDGTRSQGAMDLINLMEQLGLGVDSGRDLNSNVYSGEDLVRILTEGYNQYYGDFGTIAQQNIDNATAYTQSEETIRLSKMEGTEILNDNQATEENKKAVLDAKVALEGLQEEYDKTTKSLKDQNNALASNEKLVKASIVDAKNYEDKLTELAEAYDENKDALVDTNKGTREYQKALANITKAAKEAFGDNITEDFVENNLDLFEDWYKGAEGSADRLRSALVDSLIEASNGTESEVSRIRNIVSGLDGLNFDIYGHADATQLFNELVAVMGSAEEAARAMEVLGYSVTWEETGVKRMLILDPESPTGKRMVAIPEYKAVVTDGLGNRAGANRSSYGGNKGGGGGGGGGSEPKKWENPYDEFYNTVEKLNEELRTREKLERRYQKLLDNTNTKASDLVKNVREQLDSLQLELKTRQELLAGRERQMADIEREYSDLSDYAFYNEEKQVIEIDWTKIEALDGSTDEELTSRIEEYIGKLEEQQDLIEEEQDSIAEIEDAVKEIREQGKDEYFDLEGQIKEALEKARQEEIDKLSEINDSINDTNSRLIDAMQSSIDKYRQDRENERTEEELSDKQRRLAYLQQDTSGANALEILQLQEEIAQGQEDYTDTLIDQKISELQKQNDEAAEQRQQQIDLMQAQLDHYLDSELVWADIYSLMNSGIGPDGIIAGSALEQLLMDGASFEAMSYLEKMKWLEELENNVAKAVQWLMEGNSTEALMAIGDLSKGQKIEFTTADGKKVSGTLDKEGNVVTDTGEKYEGVYRTYNGSFVTQENYIKPEPPKPVEPTPEPEKPKVPELTTDIKRGVSAAIWNGNYGWGIGGTRTNRLTEVFGANDIQRNYVDKYITSGYSGSLSDYSYINMRKKFKQYKTGGLADFTGPAWLDGTKSRPEYILNADQTKSFFQLVDVLGSLKGGASQSSQITGDSIYDVDINVESIGNDYDVEQLASTIKRMINDDARYRNNNAINLQR